MLVEKVRKIRIIALDIDGVLTDGHITLDVRGNEQKRIFCRDLDAIGIGERLGLEFMLVTGEDSVLVDVIAQRFGISSVIRGAKDKLAALMPLLDRGLLPEHVCYVGDSDRDAAAILWAGTGVAPADASASAKAAADYVTACRGGNGVLAEIVGMIARQTAETASEAGC